MPRLFVDLRIQELKAELEKRSLSTSGNKAELTRRLRAALEEEGVDIATYEFSEVQARSGEPEQGQELSGMLQMLLMKMEELKDEQGKKMDEQSKKMDELKDEQSKKMDELKEEQSRKLTSLQDSFENKFINFEKKFESQLGEQKQLVEEKFIEHKKFLEALEEQDSKLSKELEQVRNDLEKVKISKNTAQEVTLARSIKAPIFEGQSSWAVYKRQFEAAAETHHWSDEEKATALVLALRGPAAELLQTIPVEDQKDFNALVEMMERRYGDEHMQQAYRLQLRNRVQRPGETLQQLQADVERLVYLSYSNWDQRFLREIATESFINAIRDRDLSQALRLARVETTGEALAYALAFEAAKQASRGTPFVRMLAVETEDLSAETNIKKEKSGLKCWNCGQTGHFQRQCRKRRRLESNGSERVRSCDSYAQTESTGRNKGQENWQQNSIKFSSPNQENF